MTDSEALARSSKRSMRRHQRLRMLAKALRSLKFSEMNESERIHWALRQLDQLKSCSCWMCGNPRKFEGEQTIQERRRLEAMDRDGLGPAWERD